MPDDEYVTLTHPELPDQPINVRNRPRTIEHYEARGWQRAAGERRRDDTDADADTHDATRGDDASSIDQ